MKKRRWICLALTAALTFGMLAGCGQMKDLSDGGEKKDREFRVGYAEGQKSAGWQGRWRTYIHVNLETIMILCHWVEGMNSAGTS